MVRSQQEEADGLSDLITTLQEQIGHSGQEEYPDRRASFYTQLGAFVKAAISGFRAGKNPMDSLRFAMDVVETQHQNRIHLADSSVAHRNGSYYPR